MEGIDAEVLGETSRGYCEGHFEKGVEYDLRETFYEDIDGEELWVKKLCPKCLKKFRAIVKREGGKLK